MFLAILRSCIAYIDGGSRGNPGIAGYGVFVADEQGTPLASLHKSLGIQTNNFAEYSALLAALEFARTSNYEGIKVFADSELLVRQIRGTYRVRNSQLKDLYDEAKSLISGFESFSIEHIPREQNREADRLANLAMNNQPVNDSANAQISTSRRVLAVYENRSFRLVESLDLPIGKRYYLQIDPADD